MIVIELEEGRKLKEDGRKAQGHTPTSHFTLPTSLFPLSPGHQPSFVPFVVNPQFLIGAHGAFCGTPLGFVFFPIPTQCALCDTGLWSGTALQFFPSVFIRGIIFVPLCLCAFVPLCLCAFVPLCLCAFVPNPVPLCLLMPNLPKTAWRRDPCPAFGKPGEPFFQPGR